MNIVVFYVVIAFLILTTYFALDALSQNPLIIFF